MFPSPYSFRYDHDEAELWRVRTLSKWRHKSLFLLQVVVVDTSHAVFHSVQMVPFGMYYQPVISVSCVHVFSRPSGEGTGPRI